MSKHKDNLSMKNESENIASSSTTDDKFLTSTTGKFVINQSISGNKQSAKFIKRSVDPNEIVIPRRYGEGNAPLFSRDDVKTNSCNESHKTYSLRNRNSSSSSSSSSERYRKKDNSHQNKKNDYFIKSVSRTRQKSASNQEKIPYFADEKREKERLERKQKVEKGSSVIDSSSKRNSPLRYRRSRSKTRKHFRHRSKSREKRRHRSLSKQYRRSRTRTRSRSRERHRSETTSYMPPIYPVVIAAPTPPEFICGPPNWIQQILPPRYPFIMRPLAPFPNLSNYPPVRYPIHSPNPRYMYHQTNYQPRYPRYKQSNRWFYRSRNP